MISLHRCLNKLDPANMLGSCAKVRHFPGVLAQNKHLCGCLLTNQLTSQLVFACTLHIGSKHILQIYILFLCTVNYGNA